MRPLLPWVLAVGAGAAMLLVAGRNATTARADAVRARDQFRLVSQQAQELIALRATSTEQHAPGLQAKGLAARIGGAISRCGLPASCLSSLSPETAVHVNAAESTSGIKRQRATLSLTSLTLPQLGSFLEAWRTSEPEWSVTSIDLSPLAAAQNATTGGDLPLRAVLVLEMVYAEEVGASTIKAATQPAGFQFIKQTGGPP